VAAEAITAAMMLSRTPARASAAETALPPVAPPSVHATLASAGRPLDAPIRAEMESHFGTDFGGVQLHTDPLAAASADDVAARAYTVGPHLVFGAGEYAPDCAEGRQLIAHELAHVVQQGAAPHADGRAALQRTPSPRLQRAPKPSLVRFPVLCNDLLNAPEQLLAGGKYINGTKVHAAIGRAFRAELGTPANSIGLIPGAFWSEGALGCGEAGSSQNAPRPDVYKKRGGDAPVDLVYRRGNVVEIGEIKPANPTCIPEAQEQVKHYVEKGNEDYNKAWRQSKGIDHFERMAVGRSTIRQVDVDGTVVTLSWCEPGVLVYKPLLTEGEGNVTCGIKDADLDAAVRKLEDPAQSAANQAISERLDKALDHIITDLSFKDALHKLWKVGRQTILAQIERSGGPEARKLLEQLGDEEAIDMIGDWLDKKLDHNESELLRSIAHHIKDDIINRVRDLVQAETKAALKEAIIAACATAIAGVVALSEVLAKYIQSLGKRLPQLATEVAIAWAQKAIQDLVKAVAEAALIALVAVVAIVAIIFAGPELLAAAAAIEIGALIADALAAIAALLATQWAEIVAFAGLSEGIRIMIPALP
jgi:hypothetical protein